jgi:ABC-2 type transport system permease protein
MVAMDMTGGIIDRFRTMAIARASVLTGHVLGSLIQTLAGMAILIGVAFGLGFHSTAGPLAWLATIGVLVLFAFALIWLAVALGLAAKSVETASNTPMILFLLLFLSSGFVQTQTMPGGLRQFAEYQPFTPVADTVRALLTGAAIGDHAIAAIAWSVGISVVAYLWAIGLYNRRRAAEPK